MPGCSPLLQHPPPHPHPLCPRLTLTAIRLLHVLTHPPSPLSSSPTPQRQYRAVCVCTAPPPASHPLTPPLTISGLLHVLIQSLPPSPPLTVPCCMPLYSPSSSLSLPPPPPPPPPPHHQWPAPCVCTAPPPASPTPRVGPPCDPGGTDADHTPHGGDPGGEGGGREQRGGGIVRFEWSGSVCGCGCGRGGEGGKGGGRKVCCKFCLHRAPAMCCFACGGAAATAAAAGAAAAPFSHLVQSVR